MKYVQKVSVRNVMEIWKIEMHKHVNVYKIIKMYKMFVSMTVKQIIQIKFILMESVNAKNFL